MTPTNDERARFEEFAASKGWSPVRSHAGGYMELITANAWEGWLARSLSAHAALGELADLAGDYMAAVEILIAALKDGLNVQGALSGYIGTKERLESALTTPQPSAPGVVTVTAGFALVPREVLEFYEFADMVFEPFTSQQEQLLISLKKARAAVRSRGETAAAAAQPSADDAPQSLGWQVVEVKNEGEYGDGGPDSRTRFTSYAIADSEGRILFDSLNCDHRVCEVHEEFDDEDGYRTAWDEPSRKRAEMIVARMNAAPPADARDAGWNFDMSLAPRDSTMVELLIRPESDVMLYNPLADSAEPTFTIGFNSFDDNEIAEWQFVGWNWCQDCFEPGYGTPIAWRHIRALPGDRAMGGE